MSAVAQVQAIRAVAAALVVQCDALLATLAPPPAPPSVAGPCEHPEGVRLPAPRMGAPAGWVCQRCGYEGGA